MLFSSPTEPLSTQGKQKGRIIFNRQRKNDRENLGFIFEPSSIAGQVASFVRGKNTGESLLQHAVKFNKNMAAE